MKLLFVTTIAASVLFGGAAYAAGDCIACTYVVPEPSAAYGTYKLENVPVKQNPFDTSDINQSPIRGKGAIHVLHNDITASQPQRTKVRAVCDDYPWSAASN